MTPQQIASEFQSLVNRVENAEGALKTLGKTEYETAGAFASRFRLDVNERYLRLIEERDTALTRAEKVEKERDDQKARADRNHHECTTFRVENDALRTEVARLTVAKLPTADDYSRLVKEKHEQRARADAAEAEVARLATWSSWPSCRRPQDSPGAPAHAADDGRMFVKITTVRNETLPSGATVSSFESTTEPGSVAVSVTDFGVSGIEIGTIAPTRGEAMVELAEYLLNLSREIRKAAWEQEGAVGPGVLEPRRAVDS